jgi:hypothetical protein
MRVLRGYTVIPVLSPEMGAVACSPGRVATYVPFITTWSKHKTLPGF